MIYFFLFLDTLIKGYGDVSMAANGSFVALCKNDSQIEIIGNNFKAQSCYVSSDGKGFFDFSKGLNGSYEDEYFFSAPQGTLSNSNMVMGKGVHVKASFFDFQSNGPAAFDHFGKITLKGPFEQANYLSYALDAEKIIIENSNVFLYGSPSLKGENFSFQSNAPVYHWSYEFHDVISSSDLEYFDYVFKDNILDVRGDKFFMYIDNQENSFLRISEFNLSFKDLMISSKNASIKIFEDFFNISATEGELLIKSDDFSSYAKNVFVFSDLSWKADGGVKVVF
ncbi:hypothetical protein CL645_05560 [bacterium]|nr:hypothetical protein [bacterium]MBD62296.1 hypothetical protein [bacterium]